MIMQDKVQILNDKNECVANGCLQHMDNDKVVLSLEPSDMTEEIKMLYEIRFRVMGSYKDIYDGKVSRIADNKIYIWELKNSDIQRRQDVKLDIGYETTISFHHEGQVRNLLVKVKDISTGGLQFICKSNLNMELVYETIIPITREPIVMSLEIIRKTVVEGNDCFLYGGKFIDIDAEEEKILREVIFRLQKKHFKTRENKKGDD